ncbi:PilZ domain-containing protein [Brevibacillus sp. SYSU BS000544]|uniref:PilZ domain-containing protein n=1 Tax=Brevibacillus sp. SYSU BS000544 TaxID=3416443 RepID=UPI003CE516A7
MEYKRKEMFRMVFNNPLDAKSTIVEINGVNDIQMEEHVFLHDISLHGAKFECKQDLPSDKAKIRILLSFVLIDKQLNLIGDIVWKKPSGKDFAYGVQFDVDKSIESELLWELKQFAKRNIQRK